MRPASSHTRVRQVAMQHKCERANRLHVCRSFLVGLSAASARESLEGSNVIVAQYNLRDKLSHEKQKGAAVAGCSFIPIPPYTPGVGGLSLVSCSRSQSSTHAPRYG